MNIDWGGIPTLAGIVGALILLYVLTAGRITSRKVAAAEAEEQRLHDLYDPYIAQALNDEAEYLVHEEQAMRLANDQPCSHEDNWCNGECLIEQRPRGKHHAVWSVPLDDQPSEVILAVVTDLQKKKQR